ncbi:GntR family transcriptional regulator [Streptomyces sp. NPDC059740]|uniref:GntR family transcriptional regulator n=1 Tax=Streptomyces sp. NPDC059740 TaxID=3346926 RepID=UPI00365BA7DD
MSTSETSAPTRSTAAGASRRRPAPSWIGDISQARSLIPPVRLIAARLHQDITGGLLPSARTIQQLFGIAGETVHSVIRVLTDEASVPQGPGTSVRLEQESASATAAGPLGTTSGLTRYQQIAFDLREQITAGELAPGAKMPSGVDLERRYGVASMTVRRALQILRDEGLIHAVGRSNVVAWSKDDSRASAANEEPEAGLRHTVSTITDTALDELYAELAQLRRRVATQPAVTEPDCVARPAPGIDALRP